MFSKEIHLSAYRYILLLIAVTLPFHYKLNGFFLFALFTNWLLEGDFRAKFSRVLKNKLVLLTTSFYIWYLIELLFTSNQSQGWFEVEKKSSFLILPLIIVSKYEVFENLKRDFFKFFSFSVLIAMLISIGIAVIDYLRDGNSEYFFYHHLANYVGQSAIYLSLLCLLAILFLVQEINSTYNRLNILNAIALVIIFISIILLSSKTHIAISFLLVPILLMIKKYSSKVLLYSIIVFLVFILGFLINTDNIIKERFKDVSFENVSQLKQKQFADSIYFDGLSFRLLLLKFGNEIITENKKQIIGVSPGNSQEFLNRKMLQYKLYSGNLKRKDTGYLNYNYHNQYAETYVSTGIIGLILLLVMMTEIAINAIRQKNLFMFFSLLVFAIAFLTESMLERQVGIVTFCLFFALNYKCIEIK